MSVAKRKLPGLLDRLKAVLDARPAAYRELSGRHASNFGTYLDQGPTREDEEILTEPVLADVLEEVLGFPRDAYFAQFGRSGLKPDFTPRDLVVHRFVLDAKSSAQELAGHEPQIRRYIDQRRLDYGVLFNLRELRVYGRGSRGPDRTLSFSLLPLWQVARGEALPGDEVARFEEFCRRFGYHALDNAQKISFIRRAQPWAEAELAGDAIIR